MVATVIHEVGHIIAAYMVGQSIKSIDLLDNVVLQGSPPPLSQAVTNFSGGLFSALVLGMAYVGLSKKSGGPSLFWLGVPLLFFSIFEAGNGLIEGLAKVQYIEIKLFFPGLEYMVIAGLVTVSFAVSLGAYYFRVRALDDTRVDGEGKTRNL